MNGFPPDPPRWKDRSDQSSLAERSAGEVVRGLDWAEPLSTLQLARIKTRVSSQTSRRSPFRFWVTVTAGLVLGSATAASAARLHWLPRWLTGSAETAPGTGRSSKGLTHARPRHMQNGMVAPPSSEAPAGEPSPAEPATPTSEPPAELPAPALAAPDRPAADDMNRAPRPTLGSSDRKVKRERQVSSVGPAPLARPPEPATTRPSAEIVPEAWLAGGAPALQPGPGELAPSPPNPAVESAGKVRPAERGPSPDRRAPAQAFVLRQEEIAAKPLADAIRMLRSEQAPARALALLDAHSAELSRGSLGHEALLVRVEALLALHRDGEVLRLLDATPLADVAASRSLRLVRAELRAAAGRCAEALADFELLLATPGSVDERALRGRASCRSRLAAPGATGGATP
jgi:hypothetical protein